MRVHHRCVRAKERERMTRRRRTTGSWLGALVHTSMSAQTDGSEHSVPKYDAVHAMRARLVVGNLDKMCMINSCGRSAMVVVRAGLAGWRVAIPVILSS